MGITQNFVIVPPAFFLAFHLLGGYLVGRTLVNLPHAVPICFFVFAVQGVIEHYSDKFPTIAKINAPLTLAILILIAYWLFSLFSVSTAPHWFLWCGIVVYFVVLGLAKVLELGFPKDTAEEQVEALKDPAYNFWHVVVHTIVTIVLASLSFTCPGSDNIPMLKVQDVGLAAEAPSMALPPVAVVTAAGACAAVVLGVWRRRHEVDVDGSSLLTA